MHNRFRYSLMADKSITSKPIGEILIGSVITCIQTNNIKQYVKWKSENVMCCSFCDKIFLCNRLLSRRNCFFFRTKQRLVRSNKPKYNFICNFVVDSERKIPSKSGQLFWRWLKFDTTPILRAHFFPLCKDHIKYVDGGRNSEYNKVLGAVEHVFKFPLLSCLFICCVFKDVFHSCSSVVPNNKINSEW
jgi:hypothetical protein